MANLVPTSIRVMEDEVLFERTDEDPITVATASATMSQATVHNVSMLSEKLSQVESDNYKLKEEIIGLKEEIHKQRKVDDETTPLRASILKQHEKLYDVRMKCFDKVKKMADKVKVIEKHLEYCFSDTSKDEKPAREDYRTQ